MILLDTHIWKWWVSGNPQLSAAQKQHIMANGENGLGVSIISCWEIAKKVQIGRLRLDRSLEAWMDAALGYPGIRLLPLTPAIVIESTQMPGEFHRDPADQLIVATARIINCPILTADERILAYPHVRTLK